MAAHTKLTEAQIEQWVEARNRTKAEEMDRFVSDIVWYVVNVILYIYIQVFFLIGPP